MRDAARLKLGYYPIAASALDHLAKTFRQGDHAEAHLLDPCAGEGDAVFYLAEKLGIPADHVWAIELDGQRSEALSRRHPGDNVLAPASFFGCDVKANAFSIVYCNPPYDDNGPWGRVEEMFFDEAIDKVMPGGILIGVFTERLVLSRLTTCLMTRCEEISVEPLPADVREYDEVFVVAVKRRQLVNPRGMNWKANHASTLRTQRYTVPPSPGPMAGERPRWAKVAPTDDDVYEMLQNSPLRKHLDPPPKGNESPRPPLAMSKGHIALMLAAGYLNGLVEPDDEPPHVVRGTAVKLEELAEEEETETKSEVKTTKIYRERIQLTVRAVDASGEIKTFCS